MKCEIPEIIQFEAALTLAQLQDIQQAEQNRRAQQRMMLMTLTRTSDELMQLAQDDLDIVAEIIEQLSEYSDYRKNEMELINAALARLFSTASKVMGGLEA